MGWVFRSQLALDTWSPKHKLFTPLMNRIPHVAVVGATGAHGILGAEIHPVAKKPGINLHFARRIRVERSAKKIARSFAGIGGKAAVIGAVGTPNLRSGPRSAGDSSHSRRWWYQ